jgi:hypothetical protein
VLKIIKTILFTLFLAFGGLVLSVMLFAMVKGNPDEISDNDMLTYLVVAGVPGACLGGYVGFIHSMKKFWDRHDENRGGRTLSLLCLIAILIPLFFGLISNGANMSKNQIILLAIIVITCIVRFIATFLTPKQTEQWISGFNGRNVLIVVVILAIVIALGVFVVMEVTK